MQTSVESKQPGKEWRTDKNGLESQPDIDLQKLWDEARANFYEKTKERLKEEYSFDNVISKQTQAILAVDEPNDDDIGEEERGLFTKAQIKKAFRRAKDLFKKVFQVIWKFSDFLMPMAASIPLLGAGVSFLKQAIDILITATQNYRAIFVEAGQLFEQVGFFSMRFEMLMEAQRDGVTMHRKFFLFLSRILAHTVDCAALFINLTRQCEEGLSTFRKRAKNAVEVSKQFFQVLASNNDQGVKAHMAQLQSLVEEEGKLSTALILSTVLRIQSDVVAVRGSVNMISNKLDSVNSMIGEFSTLLGPNKTDLLKAILNITGEPWIYRLRACAERRIRGTGEWLLTEDCFSSWVANQTDSPQMLAIEAASNFGKTYLATAAVTNLRERAQSGNMPVLIAYYFFDKLSKALTAGDVVRSILYQLCIQDTRFFELAYPVMQSMSGKNHDLNAQFTEDLWCSLVIDILARLAGCTCFVVLDGLERMDKEELEFLGKALAKSSAISQKLCIMVTGDATSVVCISQRSELSFAKIALDHTYPNRTDVSLVTEACLADCDLFSKRNASPGIIEYKSKVGNTLVNLVAGDFYSLRTRISDMRHLLSVGEVERVLSRRDERRQDAIKNQLSNLAVRLSAPELSQLKSILQLLSVLDVIDAPIPHISILEEYLHEEESSPGLFMTNIQSAYSTLLEIDEEGSVSLATRDIARFVVRSRASKDANTLPHFDQGKQLDAMQHFLKATFNPRALVETGFDEDFFESRRRLTSVSQFSGEANLIMANVTLQFITSLTCNFPKGMERKETKATSNGLVSYIRGVLPKLLLQINLTNLDEEITKDLGFALTQLFLDTNLLDQFWPVQGLTQVQTNWSLDHFDAIVQIIKHPIVNKHLHDHKEEYTWITKIQEMTDGNSLRLVASRMIAARWFQSKSFWTYDDIEPMFLWFTTMPNFLEEKDVNEPPYDHYRTTGWYTPPNWRKIKAWAIENIQIDDQADFTIQTGAVLCSFGGEDKTRSRLHLLEPYRETDWRAMAWLAEASSYISTSVAWDMLEEAIDGIVHQNLDDDTTIKAVDTLVAWSDGWNDPERNFRLRENLFVFSAHIPGLLTPRMMTVTLEMAIQVQGPDSGFEFFKELLEAGRSIILDTLVQQTSHNYVHIALSRTLAEDASSRIATFRGAYQEAIALCDETKSLSFRDRKLAKLKLNFWFARLLLISKVLCHLQEAVAIWEELTKGFSLNPTVADLETMVPIVTHLCSAYLHTVLANPSSSESDRVTSRLQNLKQAARFSQDSLALKLNFRVSLCLARVFVARKDLTEAQGILSEYAALAFSMISQRYNEPLASVGWFYLASILTVLGQDLEHASWAWTKVQLHQPDRWYQNNEYDNASNGDGGVNPPLADDLKAKLETIKRGEEFSFWDGFDANGITSVRPDDLYLPSYASMACDGRQCRSAQMTHNDALQVTRQYPHSSGSFTPAQIKYGRRNGYWTRVPFWVCRDCVSIKLCETCRSRLLEGTLPPIGCSSTHSGCDVSASTGFDDPYAVNDEDLVWVSKEKERWNTKQ